MYISLNYVGHLLVTSFFKLKIILDLRLLSAKLKSKLKRKFINMLEHCCNV